MASPLDNIFGNSQEDEDKIVKNPSNSSQSRTVSADPLANIFADSKSKPTPKQVQVEVAVKKEEPKSLFDKAVSVVGKVATKVGDFFSEQSRKNAEAGLPLQELMQGKVTFGQDPVTGKKTMTSARLDEYKKAKTPEQKAKILSDSQQDVPLIKFLNSKTGQQVTGAVYNATSNLPLKTIARVKSLGDDTYDEAYSALVAKSKDPENTRFEKIMYGLQDSGVQSAIGALLAVGTSLVTRNPNAGRAVSLAYFAPISAESQRQDKGQVESLGNIAIDTVGDTLISGFAETALKSIIKEGGEAGLKAFAKQMGKGFIVEGTTEPTQTVLKYANDYKNARTPADREKVVAKFSEYVKSGAMVDEFLIGGLSGAGITAVATGAGKALGSDTTIDPSMQSDGNLEEKQGKKGTVKGEFNINFSEVRDEAIALEQELRADPRNTDAVRRLTVINEQLNDYQQAVKQRPVYIADENQDAPLATVETVQYPDGKFTYSFSADIGGNAVEAPFLNTQTFDTQEQAVKAGKKAVLDWVSAQAVNADEAQIAKLKEIRSEIRKPTQVTATKISLDRDGEVSQETESDFDTKGSPEMNAKQLEKAGFDQSAMGYGESANIETIGGKPAIAYKISEDSPYALTGVSVQKDFQRQGVATKFIKSLARDGVVYVQTPNADMLKVLNKIGKVSKPNSEDIVTVTIKEDTKKDKKTSKNTEKDTKKTDKVSKNVIKTKAGVYRATQYSVKGEPQGKVEARYTKSKRNGKMFFEVTKDGERIERLPLAKAKQKYDTTDRPTMVERAINGKLNPETGRWELNQSTSPVIKNTTQNQVEKKPIKTKGVVKTSKAFQRVQSRLGEYADIDVNYNRLNLADDTARALEFIEKNPKDAKRIALGMQSAPEGVTETAISIALAEQASDKKDFALQAQLERSRSLRQTRRGQEIVSERGRFNENSPHFFMQQVLASRIEKASKEKFRFFSKSKNERSTKTVEGKMREGTESIKRAVKKKLSATDMAQSVIDQLTC